MTDDDAMAILRAEGIDVARRPFGVEGHVDGSRGKLRFQISLASAGGAALSLSAVAGAPSLPGGPIRWFQRPSLDELVALVREGNRRVRAGVAPSLFDALVALEPHRPP